MGRAHGKQERSEKMRKLTGNKKGIDTILAALLMVVIVVVASVMVYAWSTGLLSSLLVQNPVPKENMNVESFTYNANNLNLTLSVRNTGAVGLSFSSYYVKDSSGNQIARLNWSTDAAGKYPASINPNGLGTVNIAIGGSCLSSCSGGGSFSSFTSGYSYTVTLVTTRNNQFAWTGQR
jgi:FlaG/FlaF family flagellin (archaellin)